MTLLNWSDVIEVTHDEAKQSLLGLLNTVGFTATSWQEGSIPLACVELSAEIWAQLSKVSVFLKRMALNDTSEGEALTGFSASHYNNLRQKATAAQRRTALACAVTAGPHSFNVGDIVIAHPDGQTYRNIADGVTVYPATLPSGGALSSLVFEAEVAGIAANKASGTVINMVTTLAGVTVLSDVGLVNGADAESDTKLRARNTTKWALLTRYQLIRDAVVNLALNVAPGVTIADVDDQNPRGPGTFDVYVAGPLTTAGVSDVAAVQTEIDKYVFGSSAPVKTCVVIAAPEQPLNLTGTVFYRGAYSPADMLGATTAALVEFIKSIPLGGFDFTPGPSRTVPFNDITDVLREVKVSGQSVQKTVTLTSPAADLPVSSHAKVVLGTLSLTFTQIS